MSAPATTRSRVIGILCLVGATLAWAGNFLVGATATAEMGAIDLVWTRWALAVLPLFLVAQVVERPDWRAVLRHWPRHAILGAIGIAAYNLLLYVSLEHGSALNSSLINAFNPALIAIAAVLFLGARMPGRAVVGIVIAFAGVVVILTDGNPLSVLREPVQLGSLAMVGAIVAWTVYTVAGRTGPRLPAIATVAVQAAVVLALMTPFALWDGVGLPRSEGGWAALIYIAIGPSILSYVLWNLALQRVPAPQAGASLNLITVFVAIGTALIGAPIVPAQLAGGVLVLAGVLLASDLRRSPRPAAAGGASARR